SNPFGAPHAVSTSNMTSSARTNRRSMRRFVALQQEAAGRFRAMVLIKKYGNRRLYDTEASRYITLDELAARVRGGSEVRVVDAKSQEDLTGATLTQLIMENRGASRLLPVSLLHQLIRLGDDSLAEFFSRYV